MFAGRGKVEKRTLRQAASEDRLVHRQQAAVTGKLTLHGERKGAADWRVSSQKSIECVREVPPWRAQRWDHFGRARGYQLVHRGDGEEVADAVVKGSAYQPPRHRLRRNDRGRAGSIPCLLDQSNIGQLLFKELAHGLTAEGKDASQGHLLSRPFHPHAAPYQGVGDPD